MKNVFNWLKEAWEWFCVFCIMPYILIKAAFRAIKHAHELKNEPDYKVDMYKEELRRTNYKDWYKVYEKYFGEF